MKTKGSNGKGYRTSAWWIQVIVVVAIFLPLQGFCQKKISLQVKTYDQTLKPVGNIEIALNDSGFFTVGNKGDAIVELADADTKITSVRVKDEALEAASWNLSRGVVEIIIRPRTDRVLHFVLRLSDGKVLPAASITFYGSTTLKSRTDQSGKFDLQVPTKERVRSADQFRVQDFQVVGLTLSDAESTLTVMKPKPLPQTPIVVTERPKLQERSEVNLSPLDSVSTLAGFYSVIRNMPMSSLTGKERIIVDAKFKALLAMDRAVLTPLTKYNSDVSETSSATEDIKSLLRDVVSKNDALQAERTDFENKAAAISQKLDSAIVNSSDAERAGLLADIALLEKLFGENESAVSQNNNDRREIINMLKEKYFDIKTPETGLSEAEGKDEGQQQQFRLQLFAVVGVILIFGLLITLLLVYYSRLRESNSSLQNAKRKIEQLNENVEEVVMGRTRLLAESNKELDTFLYRASHDLRSPLRSIAGLCKIIGHIPQAELADRVAHATVAMDRVLNKLIDISGIVKGAANKEHVVLVDVINAIRNKQLLTMAGINSESNQGPSTISHRPLQINIHCPAEIKLYTSRSLLEIVLTNIIENAVYYSTLKPGEGQAKVEVSAAVRGSVLELVVHDNGVGISESAKPKVFDMFFTGHEESKGNGLGLYAVRRCVLALHGTVDIVSEEGEYTRVVVTVPYVQPPIRKVVKPSKEKNESIV